MKDLKNDQKNAIDRFVDALSVDSNILDIIPKSHSSKLTCSPVKYSDGTTEIIEKCVAVLREY